MDMKRMEAHILILAGGLILLSFTAGCRTISLNLKKTLPPPPKETVTQPDFPVANQQAHVVNQQANATSTQQTPDNQVTEPQLTHDQVLLNQANTYIIKGDLQSALVKFEQAIVENPKLLPAYIGAGRIYHGQGDYAMAEAKFEEATRLAPTSFQAHYYLGLMRQLLKKYPLAIKAFLYALAINPEDFSANHNLSICYLQIGRAAEAAPYALKATKLDKNSQAAWANLGSSYNVMSLYEKAIRAYRQANELGQPTEPILLGLAEAHMRLENFDRAKIVLKQVLADFPSAVAHERMGYALFKQRKYDESMEQFRAALLFDPDDTASLNGLGVCMMTKYIANGRTVQLQCEQALSAWRRSLEITPNQPQITNLLQSFGQG
jgi:superkiller protein 3